jgi:hypothetical protein
MKTHIINQAEEMKMTREEFENKYSKRIYLGDGLYANFDGYHIMLFSERENEEHWIGLEPEVFNNLLEYRTQLYVDAKNIIAEKSHFYTDEHGVLIDERGV